MEFERITGKSKGAGYHPGYIIDGKSDKRADHAWNRVKINNSWYFCEPTWAAGSGSEYKIIYHLPKSQLKQYIHKAAL